MGDFDKPFRGKPIGEWTYAELIRVIRDGEYASTLIDAAEALGIKETEARFGTKSFQGWAELVLRAKAKFDRGDMEGCKELIGEANRYAS